MRRSAWIRLLYLVPLPGLPLWVRRHFEASEEEIRRADSLLVQAMGRNSIPDSQLLAATQPYYQLATKNLLDAMRELQASGFEAGSSNEMLARHVVWLLEINPRLHGFIQWEVCFALWQQDPQWFREHQQQLSSIWPQDSTLQTLRVPFSSYKVCAVAMERIRRDRRRQLLALSHPDMIVRLTMILWRLGAAPMPIVMPGCFDSHSVQWQTRNVLWWTIRETIGRMQHAIWPWRWVKWTPPKAK